MLGWPIEITVEKREDGVFIFINKIKCMGTLFIYVESFFKIKHLSLAEQVFGKRLSLSVHLVWNKSSHENKKSFKSILS